MKHYLAVALATLLSSTVASAATLVTADRMLDVQTGRYVANPAILIGDDGRIQQVGNLAAIQVPAGTKTISLPGETLLPGLIDMHTHLGPADIGGYRFLEYTDRFWPIVAVGTARQMLDAGFTTIRVVGSEGWTDVGLKQAIEAGYAVGPRIVPAGHALGATGGHCDDTYLPPSLQKKVKEEGIGDTPDELKYQVRRQRKFGAEVIKVCATTRRASSSLPKASFAGLPMKPIWPGCEWRRTPTARTGSTLRSGPASTRSSMPAC